MVCMILQLSPIQLNLKKDKWREGIGNSKY
jgi:hypothetical protein